MNEILNVKDLNYINIFKKFNIKIEKNKFITISGPNNSGKTTFLRIISKKIEIKNSILINNRLVELYDPFQLAQNIKLISIDYGFSFIFKNVEDEIMFVIDNKNNKLTKEEKKEKFNKFLKDFKLTKYVSQDPNLLDKKNQLKIKLIIEIIKKTNIILLDNVCSIMNREETIEFIEKLKYYQKQEKNTIILATNNLTITMYSDYLYILNNGEIVLEGKPIDILTKDNFINKIGLDLPFMVDLSVKLKDYDLIENIETDIDKMVGKLWK